MFRSNYQGGAVVELFTGHGNDPVANWKLCGGSSAIHKEYDKEVKGFVYCLKGSSQTVKMQMPANGKTPLGLLQRFLVLQVYVPQSCDFSTELAITDSEHLKKRLHLSTVHKGLSATILHARIPLGGLKRNSWCTLCIDLVSLTSELFKGFVSLDGIALFATCKVRRIFTMKTQQTQMSDDDVISSAADLMELIPRNCKYPADLNQVIHVLDWKTLQKDNMAWINSSECALNPSTITARPISYGRTGSQVVSRTAMGSLASGPRQETGRKSNTTSGRVGTPSSSMNKKVTTKSDLSGNLSPGGADCIQQGVENGYRAAKESSGVTSTPAESQCRSIRPGLSSDLEVRSSLESNEETEPQLSMQEDMFTFSSYPQSPKRGQSQGEQEKMETGDDHAHKESLRRTEAQLEDDFIGSESDEDSSHKWFMTGISDSSTTRNHDGGLESQQDVDLNSFKEKQKSQKRPSNTTITAWSSAVSDTAELISTCGLTSGPFPERSENVNQNLEKILEEEEGELYDSSHFDLHQPGSLPSQRNDDDEEELRMLASLKREQDEDVCGLSLLSQSLIRKCNVSKSVSSDDTSGCTHTSMPANQGEHYQKEMSPLHQSNPREWMDVLSPPVMPPSQQRRSGNTLINWGDQVRGREHGTDDDERDDEDEYLSLLYDPSLNRYFDPKTGKYYLRA
ncbi:protein CFAP20DC isoform X2 [Gouania willdenowi]|nr:uncharacterized protein C3orf67 homolog isoform X2 [Gouania willdenowi]